MYFIIRVVLMAAVVMLVATGASAKVAAYTADQAMSLDWQHFLTGLTGIVVAIAVGGALLLAFYRVTNRE